jgi:hypothetical protein
MKLGVCNGVARFGRRHLVGHILAGEDFMSCING